MMAPRMHDYDGILLRKQLLAKRRKLVPVASMVLNYSRQLWDKDLSTYECTRFPRGIRDLLIPYVANQNIMVHNVSFLDDETIQLFRSDFRLLAEYFSKSRTDTRYNPCHTEIVHSYSFWSLMSVLTKKPVFEHILKPEKEGESVNSMSTFFEERDRLVKLEGIQIGERRGRELEREQSILNHTKLLSQKFNITADEAMTILEVPEDTQKEIRPKLVP